MSGFKGWHVVAKVSFAYTKLMFLKNASSTCSGERMVKHGLKSFILGPICHFWGAQSDHYLYQTRHLGPDIFGSNLHSHFGKASSSAEHVQVN